MQSVSEIGTLYVPLLIHAQTGMMGDRWLQRSEQTYCPEGYHMGGIHSEKIYNNIFYVTACSNAGDSKRGYGFHFRTAAAG